MFGKLSFDAVPTHEPIIMGTLAAVVLLGLALVGRSPILQMEAAADGVAHFRQREAKSGGSQPDRLVQLISIPARPAWPAGIVISTRHLSLCFKVWQRTVARGGRG